MPFRGMLIKTFREGSFMCTCITYKNGDFYFGRNMDLEYSFGEAVVITPRPASFSSYGVSSFSLCHDRHGSGAKQGR